MKSAENVLLGYASIVSNLLTPLNENKRFKKTFKHKHLKVLMNCPTWVHAALVIIDKGTLRVDGIKNKPIENIDKNVLGWQVYFETNTVLYSDILAKRKSLKDVARKWLGGEIKLKGIFYLTDLIRLFNCLYRETLLYEPSVEEIH
jgi:hypothetical protein